MDFLNGVAIRPGNTVSSQKVPYDTFFQQSSFSVIWSNNRKEEDTQLWMYFKVLWILKETEG